MSTDLAAWDLALRPERDAEVPFDTGAKARGLVYDLLGQADPDLGAQVHVLGGAKPFACSGLIGPTGVQPWIGPVGAGEACGLRLCALTAPVAVALESALVRVAETGERLRLGGAEFRVARVSASQSSYRELAASPPQGKWRLEFLSPTAFRQQTGHLPLPLPSCLFRSAFDRWNAFCPEPLRMEESLLPSAEESVFPSQVEIRTRRVRREQGSFVGFTGRVELTMVRPLPPEAASQLTALLRFLTFAGVGHGSTRGWGQVELR